MAGSLQVSLRDRLLTLTLDRPDKRNALDSGLIEALHHELERAELDADVRVVVLGGAGKDFCAGADLEEVLASAERSPGENEASALRLGTLFLRMRRLAKPVVGKVQGRALAGGAGLVTACDIAVAGAGAQLGYPEIQRGFVPAMVMSLLRRLTGEKMALDLVLTGRVLPAAEARAAGLVARVVPDTDLDSEVEELARGLADSSLTALALTKHLFYQLDSASLDDAITLGARVNALARATPECREAIARFLKK
jgi:methylglutaconyl-CoA hydratase